MKEVELNEPKAIPGSESGQSLVLIALMFVVLLLFVGLAVDVGFGFARSSMFSRAVDSAALAGVVELAPWSTNTMEADIRAAQFLAANGWTTATLTTLDTARSLTDDGIPQYSVTGTWPVETFFLRLVGIDDFPVTHAATAAYFIQSEMHTPTAYDSGHMKKSTLFQIGKEGCTFVGDPVNPLKSTADTPNEQHPEFNGLQRYRISIPKLFPLNTGDHTVRVEIFDPDSHNLNTENTALVIHSPATGLPVQSIACFTEGVGDRCIMDTGESPIAAFQNPYWIWRADESWSKECVHQVGSNLGDAITTFELYYFDATGQRQSLSKYTVDNDRDAPNSDMRWVSPGAPFSLVPADSGDFEVDFLPVPTNPNGSWSIYMDVTSEGGAGKNGYDIWAGPPRTFYTSQGMAPLNPDVNLRNLQFADDSVIYHVVGVKVFALGRLPVDFFGQVDDLVVPMVPLDIEVAGQTLYVSLFDYDPKDVGGAPIVPPPRIEITIDTVSTDGLQTFVDVGNADQIDHQCDPGLPPPQFLISSCNGGQLCENEWLRPQLQVCIPSTDSFGGGIVEARFRPHSDEHTWQFAITAGDPFLTN